MKIVGCCFVLALQVAGFAQTGASLVDPLKSSSAGPAEVRALSELADPAAAVAAIERALSADTAFESGRPRQLAYEALCAISVEKGDGTKVIALPEQVALILQGVADEDAVIRGACVSAIRRIDQQQIGLAVPALRAALRDDSWTIVESAAEAFGVRKLVDMEAAARLRGLLFDPSHESRQMWQTSQRKWANIPTEFGDPEVVFRSKMAAARISLGFLGDDLPGFATLDARGQRAAARGVFASFWAGRAIVDASGPAQVAALEFLAQHYERHPDDLADINGWPVLLGAFLPRGQGEGRPDVPSEIAQKAQEVWLRLAAASADPKISDQLTSLIRNRPAIRPK